MQDSRRNSRTTPRKIAGMYCRSLANMGFTEDDFKMNVTGSVDSNEREGENLIQFIFQFVSLFSFTQVSF